MQEEQSKEKWKVPLPFEDRLFLDRVRTRSLVRKLGVSFDLLPTEQLAVVETSQQLHAKRTYGHRGRRGGLCAGGRVARETASQQAGLYYTEYSAKAILWCLTLLGSGSEWQKTRHNF